MAQAQGTTPQPPAARRLEGRRARPHRTAPGRQRSWVAREQTRQQRSHYRIPALRSRCCLCRLCHTMCTSFGRHALASAARIGVFGSPWPPDSEQRPFDSRCMCRGLCRRRSPTRQQHNGQMQPRQQQTVHQRRQMQRRPQPARLSGYVACQTTLCEATRRLISL